jgi:hypothetical protein
MKTLCLREAVVRHSSKALKPPRAERTNASPARGRNPRWVFLASLSPLPQSCTYRLKLFLWLTELLSLVLQKIFISPRKIPMWQRPFDSLLYYFGRRVESTGVFLAASDTMSGLYVFLFFQEHISNPQHLGWCHWFTEKYHTKVLTQGI